MARSTLAGLVLFAAVLTAQQQEKESAFRQAGVCSRCHVVQVLEWSASKHPAAGTVCQSCHGGSEGHVANERNEVKPDRLPRGEREVTLLCASCHTAGCPKTSKTSGCSSCHHAHALSNPNDKQLRQPVTFAEDPRLAEFRRHMAEGERRVTRRDWGAARDAFAAAARVLPDNRRAASRLRMVERRLHPAMPGLEILDDAFDPESGLPLHVRVKEAGVEMLLVPRGDVDIGSEQWPGSRPVHSVYGEAFYLGKFEVTQEQWNRMGMENPSPVKEATLPVYGLSWKEARQWIARLNERVPGGGFRLPTEAEWERAARAAGRGVDGPLDAHAWYRDNSASGPAGPGGFREIAAYKPHPVGLKQPNAAGFFDMRGNVAEWCSSLLRPYPYDARDGRESEDAGGLRVIRGGAFVDSAGYLDAAFRHGARPGVRNYWTGLRLAR
ncbi:MAG: Hercynine oxygenase [Bryobacteraceae bacterium]|nr:Hercynine oxygenase [Bryobacteraceae bacterium]